MRPAACLSRAHLCFSSTTDGWATEPAQLLNPLGLISARRNTQQSAAVDLQINAPP
jgi:hypothetical protein